MSDEKKRGGRPPLQPGEESTRVGVRVTSDQYDRAFAKARRDRVSVPEVLRRALDRVLDDED